MSVRFLLLTLFRFSAAAAISSIHAPCDDVSDLQDSALQFPLSTSNDLPTPTALNPSCAPGGNFPELTKFTLELPIGTPNKPTQIPPSELKGCDGYQDPGHHFFFTESGDGALVMKVPGSPEKTGCIKYAESKHCRTELRETSPASWSPGASKNALNVTLAVVKIDDGSTCIGQVFMTAQAAPALKPVCELYYDHNGDISLGVEQTRAGHNQITTHVGHVPVGTKFNYVLKFEEGVLSVSINGKETKVSTNQLGEPDSFFKVGNYLQGQSASSVHFFDIGIQH